MKIPQTHRRRGISAIFGALIVFAIFFSTIVPYSIFVYITLPFQQIKAENAALQRAFEASEESLQLQAFTFSNGTLYVNGTNDGGVSVVLVAVFTGNATSGPFFENINQRAVNVGGTFSRLNSGFNCAKATLSDPCTESIVTSRGRTFSASYPLPGSGGFQCTAANNCCPPGQFIQGCLSSSTAGVGYLSFNFEQFDYYAGPCSTSSYPTGCYITPVGRAYTITGSANRYIAFSAIVTNVDPLKRTIVLSSSSYLEAAGLNVARGGGRSLVFTYQIGVVSSGVVQPFVPISIAAGRSVTVFFVSMLTGNPTDTNAPSGTLPTTPVFLLFTGTVGGLSWGENFPITSITWVS